jgi:tellurite resistance protein TehA-like permease
VLIIGGIWRHIYKRYKFIYDPLYWGLVFPLGMYAAATFQLSTVVTLPFLYEMSRFFIYVALLAWTATFFGLVHSLLSKFIGKSFQTR